MVEDHWRGFLSSGSEETSRMMILRFDDRIRAMAFTMSGDQGDVFLAVIDEERELLANEYQRGPDALKARLGLGPRQAAVVVRGSRQDLGDVAVRTAVRATVWQGIRELFRLFR